MTLTPATTPLDPFLHLTREYWDSLAQSTPLPLRDDEVVKLSSLGDPIDLEEVDAVYRPLSALIQLHVEAALRACASLDEAISAIADGMPLDVAAIDLSAALDALGEITGETMNEQVIDEVFARFCVGK